MSDGKKRYFWKGRRVNEKIYNQRISQCKNGQKRKKTCDLTSPLSDIVQGRRIIEVTHLAKELKCVQCKALLNLENIKKEKRRGLGSIWHVLCTVCNVLNEVSTDKQHVDATTKRQRFDINSKIAIGALHSGIGATHVNKILASVNMPSIDPKTFKTYENEMGTAVEKVAKESCYKWAEIQRKMTIENSNRIQQSLPESAPSNFILPEWSTGLSEIAITPANISTNLETTMAIIEPEIINQDIRSDHSESTNFSNSKETYNGTVHVAASYDMGYSTKRRGRTCDSMNGYAAFLGTETGKTIEYFTTNRGCRMCALGHPKSEHDCRLNFIGSAKAMEPFAVASMTSNSKIFKEHNIEVGILIGDDDSDCGCPCCKPITRNSKEVANALRNIPDHAFNNHNNCGHWCRYAKNPSTYEHKSPDLYEDLKDIFGKLADNADRFAAGASSQANESLNATMTSHYPKSQCYSQTASGNFRFGCAIGEKNLGERYIQEAATKRLLSPGFHTTKYRTNLRKKKEDMEGTHYESNMGLLSTNVAHDSIFNAEGINEEIIEADDDGAQVSKPIAVFFDLETSSFSKQSDILQIAAQYNESKFSVYVNPIQKIAAQASEANGLTNVRGELMLNGTRVPSIPLRLALDAFRNFLTKLKHPVVLVAHNCKFDAPILMNSMKKMTMTDDFGSVVVGFADTLPLIKSVTNRKGKGECTLTGVASWLQISADGAHNAVYDVLMLVKIIENLQLTIKQLIDRIIT
ncbi:hypothetical protein PV328_007678 [Microctonus aethiopoides]|uniref:Exonuclease domain-containing protein n=1 Tax=Microctonus aethiopoides TaxID=144406 RepID=A0AA39CA30_9HYME|nr:hypothetical protein PV328_007678 [Microctonus aethiopoides]